jgi:hypothetical protein
MQRVWSGSQRFEPMRGIDLPDEIGNHLRDKVLRQTVKA